MSLWWIILSATVRPWGALFASTTTPSVVSPSGAGVATPTPVASAHSGKNGSSGASHPGVIAPAIGGAIGGIVTIAAIIFALLFCRRRKQELRPMTFETRSATFTPPSVHYSSHFPPSSQMAQPFANVTTSRSSVPTADTNGRRTSSLQPPLARPSTSALIPPSTAFVVSSPEAEMLSNATSQTFTAGSSKSVRAQSAGSSSAPIVTTSLPPTPSGSSELTEEQAIFVNNLRSLNVPAAEIGRLMEVMRQEREGTLGTGPIQANTTFDADAPPPSYDFKSPA